MVAAPGADAPRPAAASRKGERSRDDYMQYSRRHSSVLLQPLDAIVEVTQSTNWPAVAFAQKALKALATHVAWSAKNVLVPMPH